MSKKAIVITFISTLLVVIVIAGVARLIQPRGPDQLVRFEPVSERYRFEDGRQIASGQDSSVGGAP